MLQDGDGVVVEGVEELSKSCSTKVLMLGGTPRLNDILRRK